VLTEDEVQSMFEQLQNYGRLPEDIHVDPQTPYNFNWPAWQTGIAEVLAPAIDIDYMWQAHYLRGGGYAAPSEPDGIPADALWVPTTWTSHSTSSAGAKVLARDATAALPTIYQEYLPRVQWAGIVPQTPEPQ